MDGHVDSEDLRLRLRVPKVIAGPRACASRLLAGLAFQGDVSPSCCPCRPVTELWWVRLQNRRADKLDRVLTGAPPPEAAPSSRRDSRRGHSSLLPYPQPSEQSVFTLFYDITRTQPARKRGGVTVDNDDALSSASTVFTDNQSMQRQKALAEAHAKYSALLQQQEENANQLEIFKHQEADQYASKVREMHSLQTSLRNLIDPAAAFARADIDGSGDLDFDEWHRAFGGGNGVKADVLRALFEEFDTDKSGTVSLFEFKAGLKKVNVHTGQKKINVLREALAKDEDNLKVFRADQAKQYDAKRSELLRAYRKLEQDVFEAREAWLRAKRESLGLAPRAVAVLKRTTSSSSNSRGRSARPSNVSSFQSARRRSSSRGRSGSRVSL
jgi:hypothetical protein